MSSKSLPELLMVQGIGNPLFTVCRQGAFLLVWHDIISTFLLKWVDIGQSKV